MGTSPRCCVVTKVQPSALANKRNQLAIVAVGLLLLALWLAFGATRVSNSLSAAVILGWAALLAMLGLRTRAPDAQARPESLRAPNVSPQPEPARVSASPEAQPALPLDVDFIKRLGADLRPLLNNLLGTTSLVLNSPRLEAEDRRFLEAANRSAHELVGIVNDLLDFSRLEAGEIDLREHSFDPRELIGDVADLAAQEAQLKGVEVIANIAPEVPAVLSGDVERLRQILINLVGNAVKFTSEGQVAVRLLPLELDANGGRFRFEVEDTGMGIAESEQQTLFEPFGRVSVHTLKRQEPAGLGLAVCKTLVQRMGGTLGFESSIGKGSLFWVEAPLSVPDVSSREVPLVPHRILVADGNSTVRWVLRQHLEHWGLECVDTEDIPAAIAASERAGKSGVPFHAAVIASEVMAHAPERLVDALRRQPGQAEMPLILMNRPNEAAPNVGAKFELDKPLRTSELYNSLAELFLARRRGSDRTGAFRRSKAESKILDILLVEDNQINQIVGCEIVEELGHRSHIAENGAVALDMLQERHFDVVLMDCQMPFLDGYEATRRIRALPGPISKIPIFALTAHALVGERAKVLAAGMDDYLSKPLSETELLRLLKLWVPTNRAHLPVVDAGARRSAKAVELFQNTIGEQIDVISEALEGGYVDEFRKRAHRAKNSCLALGAERLAYTCKELQGLSDAEIRSGRLAQELLHVARDEVPLTLAELSKLGPTHSVVPGAMTSS